MPVSKCNENWMLRIGEEYFCPHYANDQHFSEAKDSVIMLDQNCSAIYISLTLLAFEYSRLSLLGRFRPKKRGTNGRIRRLRILKENFSKTIRWNTSPCTAFKDQAWLQISENMASSSCSFTTVSCLLKLVISTCIMKYNSDPIWV